MTAIEDGDGHWVYARIVGAEPVAFIVRDPKGWVELPDMEGYPRADVTMLRFEEGRDVGL